jgi:hypothetical protein
LLTIFGFKETRWAYKNPESQQQPLLTSIEVGQRRPSVSQTEQVGVSIRDSFQILKRNPVYIAALVTVGVMNYVLSCHTALLVIWSKAEVSAGGIGWEQENNVSIVFSFGAFFLLVFMGVCASPLLNKWGDAKSCIVSMITTVPVLCLYPIAHYMTFSNAALWIYILLIHGFWGITQGMFAVASNLLINNTVQGSVLGAANGLAIGV